MKVSNAFFIILLNMTTEILIARVNALQEGTPPQFGIMTAQHMVEHLILTLKLSSGKITIPEFEPTEKQLFQKEALLNGGFPFPRGIKAPGLPDTLLDLRFPNLETAKEELLKTWKAYHQTFLDDPEKQTLHPRFGKLTFEEWEKFHEKHIVHHFSQFGI
ncbi:MAG: hypothetical protein RL407_443 [Bacteroidota bacterium]